MGRVMTLDAPISHLIGLIGSEQFSREFFAAISGVVPLDQCTVFVWEQGVVSKIVAHAHGVTKQKVDALAQSYVQEGYRRDPIWDNTHPTEGEGPKIIRPSDVSDLAFRREYYNSLNIFEEVSFCHEVEGRRIYLAYYRERAKGHFNNEELALLSAFNRSVTSVLNKHAVIERRLRAKASSPPPLSRAELLEKVNQAIRQEAPKLTTREAEICAGIILGYTISGLSMNCNISINTVATHRKRAYAKLGISSQSELFAHYFGLIQRFSQ